MKTLINLFILTIALAVHGQPFPFSAASYPVKAASGGSTAYKLIQWGNHYTEGNSGILISAPFTNNEGNGDFLVAVVSGSGSAAATGIFSNTLNNTWTVVTNAHSTANSLIIGTAISTGGSDTVYANVTNINDQTIEIYDFSGPVSVDSASLATGSPSNQTNNTASTCIFLLSWIDENTASAPSTTLNMTYNGVAVFTNSLHYSGGLVWTNAAGYAAGVNAFTNASASSALRVYAVTAMH